MKRLHVHVGVEDLAGSIRFYSTLFGAEPIVTKPITRSGCSMIRV
jgi:catechol 2,3-dioxygenase-like lactoylglutathione lyase family enzyme